MSTIDNSAIVKEMFSATKAMIDASLKEASFDKTVNGIIVGGSSKKNYYNVTIQGRTYTLPCMISNKFKPNTPVVVMIPQNNMDFAFIYSVLGGEDGSGTGTVSNAERADYAVTAGYANTVAVATETVVGGLLSSKGKGHVTVSPTGIATVASVLEADHATNADNATNATEATHAVNADRAAVAGTVENVPIATSTKVGGIKSSNGVGNVSVNSDGTATVELPAPPDPYVLPVATETELGGIKSSVGPGHVQVDANGIATVPDAGGIKEVPIATETEVGGVTSSQDSGKLSVNPDTGVSTINDVVTIADSGLITKPTEWGDGPWEIICTPDTPEEFIANGLPSGGAIGQILSKKSNDDYAAEWINQPQNYQLPIATSAILGGIKASTGIGHVNVDSDGYGTVELPEPYTLPIATESTLGGLKSSSGLGHVQVNENGIGTVEMLAPYILPVATDTVLGGIKSSSGQGNVSVANDGTASVELPAPYTLPIATDAVLGGVKSSTGVGAVGISATGTMNVDKVPSSENADNATLSQYSVGNEVTSVSQINKTGFFLLSGSSPDSPQPNIDTYIMSIQKPDGSFQLLGKTPDLNGYAWWQKAGNQAWSSAWNRVEAPNGLFTNIIDNGYLMNPISSYNNPGMVASEGMWFGSDDIIDRWYIHALEVTPTNDGLKLTEETQKSGWECIMEQRLHMDQRKVIVKSKRVTLNIEYIPVNIPVSTKLFVRFGLIGGEITKTTTIEPVTNGNTIQLYSTTFAFTDAQLAMFDLNNFDGNQKFYFFWYPSANSATNTQVIIRKIWMTPGNVAGPDYYYSQGIELAQSQHNVYIMSTSTSYNDWLIYPGVIAGSSLNQLWVTIPNITGMNSPHKVTLTGSVSIVSSSGSFLSGATWDSPMNISSFTTSLYGGQKYPLTILFQKSTAFTGVTSTMQVTVLFRTLNLKISNHG